MAPVTGFGIAPFELAHEAQVHWSSLDVAGEVWAVTAWDDSPSYFATLENNGAELDKAT